ncbi:MAG: phage tail tape measure protein [Candidatus Peribacteraceae bacterium]|nr:phage tail tape measure protein [Candidatus Peribacteraceae bacterium]
MRKTSTAVSKFSNKMTSLQSVAGGLAAGLGGKVALDKFAGFETAMNKLESVTFASTSQMKQMRDVAKELGKTTKFTAGQAAEGMTFLAMAGLEVKEVLTAIPGALQLAAAGGIELGQAADIATNVLGQMGFTVEELTRVNDVLALAQSKANFNITELFESMRPVATTAKNLGISLEELTAHLGAMANAGEKGSIAGTLLRNALTKIAGASKKQRGIYKALGIDLGLFVDKAGQITNFKGLIGELQRLKKEGRLTIPILQALYGERGFRAIQVLAGAGAKSIGELQTKLTGAAGAAEKAANIQMKGLPGVLASMASAFEAVNTSVFESGLADLLVRVGNTITTIARAASGTNPVLLKIAGIFALVVAVVAPLVVILGIVGAAVGAIATFFGTAVGPVLAVAGAVMAVVTALTSLWAYKDKIGGFFKGLFRGGKGLLGGLLEGPEAGRLGGGVAARGAAAANGTLNGAIRVSAAPGSRVESAGMSTTLPGNLGFNMAGAQ